MGKKLVQKVVAVTDRLTLTTLNEYLEDGWLVDLSTPLPSSNTMDRGTVYFTIKKEIEEDE